MGGLEKFDRRIRCHPTRSQRRSQTHPLQGRVALHNPHMERSIVRGRSRDGLEPTQQPASVRHQNTRHLAPTHPSAIESQAHTKAARTQVTEHGPNIRRHSPTPFAHRVNVRHHPRVKPHPTHLAQPLPTIGDRKVHGDDATLQRDPHRGTGLQGNSQIPGQLVAGTPRHNPHRCTGMGGCGQRRPHGSVAATHQHTIRPGLRQGTGNQLRPSRGFRTLIKTR
jgi:hypothetical protein